MAELESSALTGTTGAGLTLQQLSSVAWLRWRIYANGFRRRGGTGEFIGRILLLPFVVALTLGPSIAAGFASWYLASQGSLGTLRWVFWAAFGLSQLFNINLGQPGTTFDPTELIRFPLTPRSYVVVRLGFGMLSPGNLVVSLMSFASFVGASIALPQVWPQTLLATAAFAAANVLFSRMVFAWVDRWLSTRRAREIFTGFIFLGSLLFQYINLNYNPGFQHAHGRHASTLHVHAAQGIFAHLLPYLRWLPPELTSDSIRLAQAGALSRSLLLSAITLLYALLFLLVYARRMFTEYRGENLSDAANAVRVTEPHTTTPPRIGSPAPLPSTAASASPERARSLLPPALLPLLGKEFLLLRRNVGLLYGVIAPIVMVFLFAGRWSVRGNSTHWVLLIAAAYALLGLAPMSYNTFGAEGAGAQLYFLSPVPLREVFFAKNCMQFLLALVEIALVVTVVGFFAGRPTVTDVLFLLLWSAMALMVNTSIGNLRSISAPKKIQPGKALNRTQSQLSAWIAIGILLACAGLGAAIQLASWYLHLPWLNLLLIAALAALALLAYERGLQGIEAYAMERRESLFEELGKKG